MGLTAFRISTRNTITPTHRLLTKRPVLPVYPNTQGEMKVQMASRQLIYARPEETAGELSWMPARIAITAPTIQLLKALPFVYAPYTQGEMNNQMPASNAMVLAAFIAPIS